MAMAKKNMQGKYIGDSSHTYRTELPNILLEPDHPIYGPKDSGLTIWDLGLYIAYKRTASDSGTCWKSIRTLGAEARMSHGKVVTCHRHLLELGLVVDQWSDDRDREEVWIVDIWPENMMWFRNKGWSRDDQGGHEVTEGGHEVTLRRTQEEEHKKNRIDPMKPKGTIEVEPGLFQRM